MKVRFTPRRLAGTALALGLATAAIIGGSSALWSATTSNPGNSVTAATFTLTSSKPTGSIFVAATNAKPGSFGTGSATLTNGGSIPMDLTLAQTGESAANDLSGALKLRVFDGTNCLYPAATGACVAWGNWDAGTALDNLSLGTLGAAGSGTNTRTVTVDWEFPSATTGTTGQGQAASFDLGFTGTQQP